jgi:3-keto-5-aminohexanoate cleavage enzyme
MATLDCGTLNFGGDDIFVNTENDIKKVANFFKEKGIKPELECFEKGHIDSILRLYKKGYLETPLHISFVLGVNGGMSGEMRDFLFLTESIPHDATFSVAGIGKYEFPLATYSILSGGHVRVGLEDNIYLSKGVLANSNAELVEKVVKIANLFGREIASYEDTLRILKIKGE